MRKIYPYDLLRMFNYGEDKLPKEFLAGLDRVNTEYREATPAEFEEYALYVLKLINSPITRTREENYEAWEQGIGEVLEGFIAGGLSPQALKPQYFRPIKFFRCQKKLVITENLNLEFELLSLVKYLLFARYLSSSENIYEFGCGSCHNLLTLSQMFPAKRLYGLDWAKASVKIARLLAKQGKNIEGILFDMMEPSDVIIKPNSALFTIHSLEQLGDQFGKLLAYIIAAKPDIVLNYEPIVEFYDEDNLLDYLALLYSGKRNYLSGFWTALCKLEEEKKVEIIEARRPYLGGIIHEASLVVWRPK